MKVITTFEISNECLENSSFDIERMEYEKACNRTVIEIMKNEQFHPKRISREELIERGDSHAWAFTQKYKQVIHVYTEEQMHNIFAKIHLLKTKTRNIRAQEVLSNMQTILSL